MNNRLKNLLLWKHYFFDLPLFSLGFRYRYLENWDRKICTHDLAVQGAIYLQNCMGNDFCQLSAQDIASRLNKVVLVRESDIYKIPFITQKNISDLFQIKGLASLKKAHQQNRPVVLLGGHLGSNYSMWITLNKLGYQVYPVARAVDPTPGTPNARKAYMHATYFLTNLNWSGRYLMADSLGHFPRGQFNHMLDKVFQKNGICFAAIDFPPTLYTGKQETVSFLGGKSPLPINFISLCLEKKAQFFTILESVKFNNSQIIRQIQLSPIQDINHAPEILQIYANRLTSFICREPWQWMGLYIARQYRDQEKTT